MHSVNFISLNKINPCVYLSSLTDEEYAADQIPPDLFDDEKVDEELADLLPLSKQDLPPPTTCRQIRAQLLKRYDVLL